MTHLYRGSPVFVIKLDSMEGSRCLLILAGFLGRGREMGGGEGEAGRTRKRKGRLVRRDQITF